MFCTVSRRRLSGAFGNDSATLLELSVATCCGAIVLSHPTTMQLGPSTMKRVFTLGALLVALPAASACFWDEATKEPDPVIASVVMVPASAIIRVGQTVNLIATARSSAGEPVFNKTYVWTSGDTAILESRPGGVFFAKKVGNTTAKATVDGFVGIAQVVIQP